MTAWDWERLLRKAPFEYLNAMIAPSSLKKWPIKSHELELLYDPHHMPLDGIAWTCSIIGGSSQIRDPVADAPVLCYPTIADVDTDFHDTIDGAMHAIDLGFDHGEHYLPILTEAKNPWEQGFINHFRIVDYSYLGKQLGIGKDDLERLPGQEQKSYFMVKFIEDQYRNLEPTDFGYPPYKVAQCSEPETIVNNWEPWLAIRMVNVGPFSDIFSRPVLRPKKK